MIMQSLLLKTKQTLQSMTINLRDIGILLKMNIGANGTNYSLYMLKQETNHCQL